MYYSVISVIADDYFIKYLIAHFSVQDTVIK